MRVTLIAAQSIDGFITRHDEPGTAFTSAADQSYFARALEAFDCSIMGSHTYEVARAAILPQLHRPRRRVVLTRQPSRYAQEQVSGRLEFTAEAPDVLRARLAREGHRACALLGGAQIHRLFLDAGLVDELWLTLEPRLFGQGTAFAPDRRDVRLSLVSHERLSGSDTLLLKYTVQR